MSDPLLTGKSDLLEKARAHLLASMHGKLNVDETLHPWRQDWEFAVMHSLRVEGYVLRILDREPHRLSVSKIQQLQLAAILHDIARLDQREGHARAGAVIARSWLREQASEELTEGEIDAVAALIADHSNKTETGPDFRIAILKDADTLDEIGAMSIFMAANWLERRSPFFFYRLRERMIEFELPFCDQKLAILQTRGARDILLEKKAFIQNFIDQLSEEIQLDGPIQSLFGME